MTDFSFPWPSTDSDRQVSSPQQRALYARAFSNGVMKAFTGTVTGTTLNMTAGSAIINGAFYDVGTGAAVALPGSGSSATIVVRYDETARTVSLAAITTAPVDAGGVLDVPIATLTKSGSVWSAPTFSWAWCEPIGTDRRKVTTDALAALVEARTGQASATDCFAAIGYTLGSPNHYRRSGKVVQVLVAFALAADVATDATGMIADLGITPASLAAWTGARPAISSPMLVTGLQNSATYRGNSVGSGWIDTDGVVHVTHLGLPSHTYTAGTWFVASATYVIA